jgi:hypothetical protein
MNKWYFNDWFLSFMFWASFAIAMLVNCLIISGAYE